MLRRLCNLRNAFRVLEIMDKVGCDIEKTEDFSGFYKILPKWYVSEEDAKDLRSIVLYHENYKKDSVVQKIFFRNIRKGMRVHI